MESERNHLLIFSGLLIAYEYLDVAIEKIPFTDVTIETEGNVALILAALVLYFSTQYAWKWFAADARSRSKFEFLSAIFITILALTPIIYGYLKALGIDWITIGVALAIMVAGVLPAIGLDLIIAIVFSIRTKNEMQSLGLGRIPSASKAFLYSSAVILPASIAIYIALYFAHDIFPTPLGTSWQTLLFIPAMLINLDSIFNILLLFGPVKVRTNALKRLRVFRRAMDLHEMHYQYLGVEKIQDYEIPPICEYAQKGEFAKIDEVLAAGADPNRQDKRGWTPLMYASAESEAAIVELLLEHGADPNIVNYLGRTALMYASNYGYTEIIRKLLQKGATPNPSNELTGFPPLSAAAQKGHLEAVKLLIESGADVMFQDNDGKTALAIAMEHSQGEIAKHLRKRMLEIDGSNLDDKTNPIKNTSWL